MNQTIHRSFSFRRNFSWLLAALALAVFAVACGGNTPTEPPTQPSAPTQVPPAFTSEPAGTALAELPIPTGNALPWLSVYFTNPTPPDDRARGLDVNVMLPLISQARRSIDAAYFDFNMPTIVDGLIAAHRRGVQVRLVVDSRNGNLAVTAARGRTAYDALVALQQARVPMVDGGRSSGLMHEKLMIIDGRVMFVGSMNASWNDTLRNNNNLLMVTSQRLIANYQVVFNNMFERKLFGSKRPEGAQSQVLNINGVTVENYFAPPDKVMSRIIAEVSKAKQSIRFMSFTFTDKNLAQAILERSRAKVTVQGVIENRGASQGVQPVLACAGLPVNVDGNSYTMHHKVFIIDDQTVITGSFNHTKAADTINDESILILRSPVVAQMYRAEFEKVFGASGAPKELKCDGQATAAPAKDVCPDIEATCDQLTCDQALACLRNGNENLDRNNDGIPCESKCK